MNRGISILLGGAMAAFIAGAGFAQTTSDSTLTKETVHRHAVVHHYHHVMRRRIVHAAAISGATPAERVETNSLNRDQLYSAQYATGPRNMQGSAAYYPQEPGQNTGITPVRRTPNGIPFQAVTPAGGRADPSTLDQAHSR